MKNQSYLLITITFALILVRLNSSGQDKFVQFSLDGFPIYDELNCEFYKENTDRYLKNLFLRPEIFYRLSDEYSLGADYLRYNSIYYFLMDASNGFMPNKTVTGMSYHGVSLFGGYDLNISRNLSVMPSLGIAYRKRSLYFTHVNVLEGLHYRDNPQSEMGLRYGVNVQYEFFQREAVDIFWRLTFTYFDYGAFDVWGGSIGFGIELFKRD